MKKKSPLILVKLGGSLITDKAGHEVVRSDVLARLAGELYGVAKAFDGGIVLGHGSGSYGHVAATGGGWSSPTTKPSPEVVARTQDAAARLHREVMTALLEVGLAPFSVAPGSLMVSSKGRLDSLNCEPLIQAVGSGLVPVLFGDVVLDLENRATIFSTERVFLSITPVLMAKRFAVQAAYWLGNTDGVLGSAGKTIGRISKANATEVLEGLGDSGGASGGIGSSGAGDSENEVSHATDVTDVTGGMRHRVESALALSRLGVPSWILNGTSGDALAQAVAGDEVRGTYVDPD